MNVARKILLYGAFLLSIFLLWQNVVLTPCSRVIKYDIGSFDERFHLSKSDLLMHIKEAETVWEEAAGKELFDYVPGSNFKINLVWSDEQESLYRGNSIEESLNRRQDSIDRIQRRYQEYVTRYERALKDYEKRLSDYEKDVTYWNEQGGAPKEEYELLQKEADTLDRRADELNNLLSQINKLAEENNHLIQNYNDGVSEYNQLFNYGHEFDAGNTDGTEINIYSYDGHDELTTLLIHEFGHVLGIDHLDDPSSVMYYLLNEQNSDGILTERDKEALSISCRL